MAKKTRIRKDIIYSASLVLNRKKTNELANQLNPYENIIEWGIEYLDPLANSFFFVEALKETKEILDGVLYALKVKENKIQIDKDKQKIIQEFDTRTVIQKYMKLYNKFMEE